MAVSYCPKCDVPLTRSEVDSGVCPSCGRDLPDPGYFDDRADRARTYRDYSQQDGASSGSWQTVRRGLTTMLVSYILLLATYVLVFGLVVISNQLKGARSDAAIVLALGMICVLMVIAIGYLVGMVMCLWAPAGRGWMAGALSCLAAIFCVACISVAINALRGRGNQGLDDLPIVARLAVLAIINLLSLGCGLCLVWFLRAVALAFSRRALSLSCTWFLALLIVFWILLAAQTTFLVVSAAVNRPFFFGEGNRASIVLGGIMILIGIIMITLATWKVVLLWLVRNAIKTR